MGMKPAIDITAEQRRTVLALLNRYLPDTTAWACGSRVKWTARPESDLDLVVFARPEQGARVAELREAFEESDLPFRVDLFVWDDISENLRKRIKSEYGVLVEADHHDSGHGWRKTTLGNVVELKRGYDLPQRERRYGEIPIVSSSGVTDYHFQSKIRGPGVVTGRYGTLGQVFFVPGDFWPLNTTLYVRDFKGNDPRFVSYLLKVFDFSAYSDKAAVPGLNRNHLHQASIHIPENVAEQRAIGHVLGMLEDKIELNRRMNETLGAMARALFKSWFVDFDPVRAKMEGRDTGLPKSLANHFPNKLAESEFGLIPEGWDVGTLGDIASLNPESWSARNPPEDIIYVDLANTKWGHIEKVETYSWIKAPSRARRALRPGDTIVGTVRPGNGSFAFIGRDGLTGSTGFAVLRPYESNDREVVWCAATSRDNIDRLAHLADGGAYPAIRPQAVTGTPVVLADLPVRRAFSSMTTPWLDRIEHNRRESRKLASLRNTLLPVLVSGKLRIPSSYALTS